jgi:hypothetical protein
MPTMSYIKKDKNKRDFWIERFISVHGDKYGYSHVETIQNQNDKLDIECPKHGMFKQTAKAHFMGQGCPECANERRRENSKGNWRSFVREAETRFPDRFEFPNIEVEYENSHSRITIKCKRDGNVFKKIACDFITSPNGGCRMCYKESFNEYYSYDELQVKTDIQLKPFDGNVERRGKVVAICNTHGEYEVLVKTLLEGRGKCKACCGFNTEEHFNGKKEEFVRKDKKLYNGKFSFSLDEYTGWGKKMKFVCNDCGHVTYRTPQEHVGNGFRNCLDCARTQRAHNAVKSNEEFIAESKSLFPDEFEYDKCIYNGSNKKVTLKCKKCGKYFDVEANAHLSRHHGCPHHYRNHSMAEEEITDFIKKLGGTPYMGYRGLLENRYELDIFDEEKMLAIEYDGIFWHNENNKPKNYHLSKTIECKNHGIHLIHIFEDEWNNPVKKDIWKSMLANLYGKTDNRIYARNCEIRELGKRECYDFLDNNHLQGKCASKIRLGLYHDNELVSVMTFGNTRHFIGGSNHQYELLRFCSKKHTNVIGGAGKLFNHFIKAYSPKSIVSYADRRWSTGNLYNILGFTLYNESRPNYYYVIDNERKNRFNFRKNILTKKYGCPENMSEHDFCKSKGWYRIYDCGCLCYEWINNDKNIQK